MPQGSSDDAGLHRVLESIDRRLTGIEVKLESLVRLEERVRNHSAVIARYGLRLDENDVRIRELELWQANHNSDAVTLKSARDNIELVKQEIDSIKQNDNITEGHKDIAKELLKLISVVLAGVLVFMFTKGD